ncbi:MAG: 3-oxoacyl-ACP reductase FabG [Pseudomonadales bacterium]
MTAAAAQPTVALVTGASRGIGRAIALALQAEGHYVVGTATTDAGAQAITETLRSAGAQGEGAVLSANDPETTTALFSHLTKTCGPAAIVVNNAGMTRDNLLLRMSEEEWQAVMQANLALVFRVCKAALRGMMKARWGRIINISSVVGRSGNPGQTNYAASKAGLEGFTRSLALEVASRNITVNAIAPGFIETDMTAALSEEQTQALLASIPLGRMGRVADVAAAVLYLCSSGADYVTGETLHINGGMRLD